MSGWTVSAKLESISSEKTLCVFFITFHGRRDGDCDILSGE